MEAESSSGEAARGGTRNLSGRVGRGDDGNAVLGLGSCRVEGGRVAIVECLEFLFSVLWSFPSLVILRLRFDEFGKYIKASYLWLVSMANSTILKPYS